MTPREGTTRSMEDALNAAQVEFSSNPRFLPPQFSQFWEAQRRVLDEAETVSSSWFARRQDAMTSMFDLGRRILSDGGAHPADTLKAVADWQVGSMDRLAEDAADCVGIVNRVTAALVNEEADPGGNRPGPRNAR